MYPPPRISLKTPVTLRGILLLILYYSLYKCDITCSTNARQRRNRIV